MTPTHSNTPLHLRQPNSRHCFVCGVENPFGLHLRFTYADPGEVTTEYTVPERYQGYPGVVHGGVVTAMLDEVASRSLIGIEPPRFMYTARLEVRFRKNVPIGQPLRIFGKAEKRKGRTALASAWIYDQEGTLLADAEALLIDVPEDLLKGAELEALGWRVYEDHEINQMENAQEGQD